MSVFKRLTNVARGKMKEISRTLSTDPDPGGDPSWEPDELDPDRPPDGWQARRAAEPPSGGPSSKREMLARLKEEGLLTEEEYAVKVAQLDAVEGAGDGPPAPPRPRKRRL